ncbi:DUF29 domain-containing protein [Methylobacterium organophilum]|uniref:Amidohydrolase n=1 Tax=Methylobacterium organophilum TaxID=410 RepID=A0ABQ4TC62_METOR|nr:DUF29 domain-containing protein [Methylobacterium organophilum]GJE29296.1 hypothetical protein LKMONMHP_4175 [Methylobacterium organophilum]
MTKAALKPPPAADLYGTDFHAWRIGRILKSSPSLKKYPAEVFSESYLAGRLEAARETGIDFSLFPEQPPFTVEQALDPDFLPKEPGLLDPSRIP